MQFWILTCYFCRDGWAAFALLQAERDGSADQGEGLALSAGRLGQHRHLGGGFR
jgi:hypothetical protein